MSVGTGIFLSSVLLAIVILYGITKDRWSWRRIVKRTALVCLGLIILGAAVIAGSHFWDQLPTKLTRQTEYGGVRLGMTQDEVMYIKGYPPVVLVEGDDPQWKGLPRVVETKNLEKGKGAIDYRDWTYDGYEHRIDVTFNEERTAVIAVRCYSNDKSFRCPAIGGVRDGDTEKEALRRLGNPSASKIDGVTKLLTYRDLGIVLWLTKEQVYMMSIADPAR